MVMPTRSLPGGYGGIPYTSKDPVGSFSTTPPRKIFIEIF
jgi:hypothetical protein